MIRARGVSRKEAQLVTVNRKGAYRIFLVSATGCDRGPEIIVSRLWCLSQRFMNLSRKSLEASERVIFLMETFLMGIFVSGT